MAKRTTNGHRGPGVSAPPQPRREQPTKKATASKTVASTATATSASYQTRREQRAERTGRRAEALARAQKQAQMKRYGIIGGGILAVLLVAILIVNQVRASATANLITGTGTYTTAANGFDRDGMSCLGMEGTAQHIHMYLAIYVNGQQVQVPPDTGIVNSGSCYYPLHVHADKGDENIIHLESPNNDTYTLGAFFDVWGQQLSSTQVMTYHADASHKLTFVTIDGQGHKTTYTGNPLNIKFSEHETIYILYNSSNVNPQPFTQWIAGE